METSPAQHFPGRRCRTLLPTAESLLCPHYPTQADGRDIRKQKLSNKFTIISIRSKELQNLHPGDTVQMRLPGEAIWSSGECI